MTIYNMMTMSGWGTGFQIGWIMSWISLVIVFFIGFILKKQCDEGFLAGTNYNVIGALVVGLLADIALVTFTGSPAWGLLAGLGGIALGGFVVGMIAPMESSGDY